MRAPIRSSRSRARVRRPRLTRAVRQGDADEDRRPGTGGGLDLDAAAVHDVLFSIYRPMRSQPVDAMRVTFSLDLLLFRAA